MFILLKDKQMNASYHITSLVEKKRTIEFHFLAPTELL